MRIHKNQALVAILLVLVFSQISANPINRHNAIKHAQTATQASNAGDWDLARREWAKAVVNAELGGLESKKRAVFYYEYGRSAGVACFYDIAEEYLNKAYELDEEIDGPSFLSLVELFRLNLDQMKYKEAVDYFVIMIPALEKVNAKEESPAEYSRLLEEYSIALKAIGDLEKVERVKKEALELRESAEHSITDRTPYGTECTTTEK